MNAEAQRIKIAEACGHIHTAHELFTPDRWAIWYADVVHLIPDYLNDLNAMHEAEKVLTDEQRYHYGAFLSHLNRCDGLTDKFNLIHATAAQRAEAFLRTIGKWDDAT